jgi:hypothetical protein
MRFFYGFSKDSQNASCAILSSCLTFEKPIRGFFALTFNCTGVVPFLKPLTNTLALGGSVSNKTFLFESVKIDAQFEVHIIVSAIAIIDNFLSII